MHSCRSSEGGPKGSPISSVERLTGTLTRRLARVRTPATTQLTDPTDSVSTDSAGGDRFVGPSTYGSGTGRQKQQLQVAPQQDLQDAVALLPRRDRGRLSPEEVGSRMRRYELMVILDPELEERTVAPSLDQFLGVIRQGGGSVEKVDIWGRRRLAYEISKKSEGIYAVVDLNAEPADMKELDRQLNLNEAVLRTKVIRPDVR